MAVAAQDLRLDSAAPTFSFPSLVLSRRTKHTGLACIQASQSSAKQSVLKWLARHSKMASAACTASLSDPISVRNIHSNQDSILAAPMYSRKLALERK